MISSLIFMAFVTTGCTVYKSAVRKDFESQTDGRVVPAAVATPHCQKISAVSAWLEKEFPVEGGELLLAEPDLEVWKTQDPQGVIRVRSFLATNEGTQTCFKDFPNEKVWSMLRSSYMAELEALLN